MKTLLIVEDTKLNLDLLTQLLEDEFNLIIARNGEEGVQSAQSARPDLILMDMSLPIKDGWTAIVEIKAIPDLAATPIIGLSAHAMAIDRQKALEHGCDEYLTKPFDENLLFDAIQRLIGV